MNIDIKRGDKFTSKVTGAWWRITAIDEKRAIVRFTFGLASNKKKVGQATLSIGDFMIAMSGMKKERP